MRLDAYLVANGLCRSRATASESIKNGCVIVNGRIVTKPSCEVSGDEAICIEAVNEKYVSRGGYKLEGALQGFGIDVTDYVCVDIGASTGGFTDCLLQKGARSVLAIDSGSGQLDSRIASDSRVVSLENTNIRSFTPNSLYFADFICVDVSFISLKYVLPAIDMMLKQTGEAVCLIKPQFEAGKENIGKNGIVKDPKVYKKVLTDIVNCANENNLVTERLIPSPITGGDGNIEFLCNLTRGSKTVDTNGIIAVVEEAVNIHRRKK